MLTYKDQPLTKQNSAHLDMVRSLATFAVVAEHVLRLFFTTESTSAGLLPTVIAVASRLANESVMVFFVLSGFFISKSVLKGLSRWTWKHYLIDRLSRLYTVLVPALLFTMALDAITAHTAGAPHFLAQPLTPFSIIPVTRTHTASIFLGNVGFLQTITVPAFGSDLPLWSLSYEFWYYMVFPCLCLGLVSRRWASRLTYFVLLGLFVTLLPHTIVKYVLIWFFGVAVQRLSTLQVSRLVRTAAILLSVCFVAAGLFLPATQSITKWHLDLLFSAGFALWLAALVRLKQPEQKTSTGYARLAGGFAGCSYSVYVTHFPLLLLIRSSLAQSAWSLAPVPVLIGCALVVLMVGFGWLFARMTEAHTPWVRKTVAAWSERLGLWRSLVPAAQPQP